jgi:hypothetical protein
MKKKLFSILLFITFTAYVKAQTYGNEWINYSQNYYKIKIIQNGVYRITPSTLASAGILINSIDPRNFQIFNNGVEQKIYVEGESDGTLDSADFIEFYAEKNDGSRELPLYTNTSFVPNPYYSLVNDTAVYFLTWNALTSNNRMALETDVSFASYTPDSYFFKDQIQAYSGSYYNGTTDNTGGTSPLYVSSEGYFDSQVINLGGSLTYNVSTTNLFSAGPYAIMETVVVGASQDFNAISHGDFDHHINIGFKPSNATNFTFFKDTLFKGYAANKYNSIVSPAQLGNNTTTIQYTSIADTAFISNRTVVSYIRIKYPHTFNLGGGNSFLIYLPDNTNQLKSYLNISNFSSSGTVRLYNLSNGTRVTVAQSGSNYNALIANSGIEKKCFITSDGYISNVTSLQPVTPSAQFTNYASLSVDSAFIIVYNKKLLSSVNDYKNYRSTNTYGGQHNVVLANIDELYDQFAYGIVKSPLSIKNFSNYLLHIYPTTPKNLLLIGKSLHLYLCRTNTTNYANCLVPSFGSPSSDALFTVGLNGSTLEPGIPTGRIAAQSNADVTVYLNKLQLYENTLNNPPAEWKKQVLHFGGGNTDVEQKTIQRYLNGYRDTIQGIYYGGKVTSFFKTSSAPIEITTSNTLTDFMDNGNSLMTFFGHAAGLGFDQSIDDINSYNPIEGHYPFMLANGCYTGDIHETTLSSSENYVLTSKGVIGYLGSIELGIPYALNVYTQEWYDQLARKSYGKSIGTVIQQTIKSISSIATADPVVGATCYEITLHGDPSVKINTESKPDYVITYDKIYFDTDKYADSVIVHVIRTNIGKATNDTIVNELTRTLPNGQKQFYLLRNAAPKYKDTVTFTFFVDVSLDIGENKVNVMLDAYNEVSELNENNNSTGDVNLVINGSGIEPIYPYEFAIIPTDTVTLKASTINPFEKTQNYIFQIDTNDTYNSPFMQKTSINGAGGVLQWKPPITFKDSTVYYWRVSPDSTTTRGYLWKESSFQYITNKSGWGQAHFFQFKNDGYQYVQFNRPQRKFIFQNTAENVQMHNAIYPTINWNLINWKLNGYVEATWHCNGYNPSITVVVLNPKDASNVLSPVVANPVGSANNGVYNNCQCRNYAQTDFDFLVSTPAQRTYLTNFLNNASVIPNGYYVLVYSMNSVTFQAFEPSLLQAFQSLGSYQIDHGNVPSSVPYILWGKKGDPAGSATEIIGNSSSSIIDLNTTFYTNWTNGTISSPIIGPAKSWGSFHWRQHAIGGVAANEDIASVKLIGIKPDGSESTLANFSKDSIDILNLSSYVNAAIYPTIRLVANMNDDSLHLPPQMDRWQVIYDPVPEGALNPPLGFYLSNDTLQIGESATIRIPFQNISNIPFSDSLLFTYWVEDVKGVITYLPSKLKKKNLMPNEILIDTLTLNTLNYPEISAFWVEVNPVNQPKSQLEQYHFNNITRVPLVINSDKINPLLDVTFDGVHILNNDLVSAKPNILISLKDENQFLALNDTGDFKVFIQTPGSSVAQPIHFGNEMIFTPAVLPNNSCKISYTPKLPQDGTYQLLVQAKDRSNNLSGEVDYKINFNVVNKSTITQVMNYPNPFSTATHFVFTLTGSEIPTYFKIQIVTITGKVVREITEDELGPIHIGRNITEYAWNGKDEFGDQLANGVYLYHVVTSINGQAIEQQSSGADQYFKKEFGKMYLMR